MPERESASFDRRSRGTRPARTGRGREQAGGSNRASWSADGTARTVASIAAIYGPCIRSTFLMSRPPPDRFVTGPTAGAGAACRSPAPSVSGRHRPAEPQPQRRHHRRQADDDSRAVRCEGVVDLIADPRRYVPVAHPGHRDRPVRRLILIGVSRSIQCRSWPARRSRLLGHTSCCRLLRPTATPGDRPRSGVAERGAIPPVAGRALGCARRPRRSRLDEELTSDDNGRTTAAEAVLPSDAGSTAAAAAELVARRPRPRRTLEGQAAYRGDVVTPRAPERHAADAHQAKSSAARV